MLEDFQHSATGAAHSKHMRRSEAKQAPILTQILRGDRNTRLPCCNTFSFPAATVLLKFLQTNVYLLNLTNPYFKNLSA